MSTHDGDFYGLTSKDIEGNDVDFGIFRNRVAMITNVASK